MLPQVIWFRHFHENRNDLLRFGLIRLCLSGVIRYEEQPFAAIGQYGFSEKIAKLDNPRHVSFLLVRYGNRSIRCLLDSEDSFALLSPFISEVDVCFCSGYNADFLEKKQFVQPYSWQNAADLSWYEKILEEKIKTLGVHFHKVKRFVPIAPNQGTAIPVPAWKQKISNAVHRLRVSAGKGIDYMPVYRGFEIRENYLKSLRNSTLQYDVVLNDSLWGWPAHRINLHTKLGELDQKGYQIHSVLNWTEPSGCDGGHSKAISSENFPIKTRSIANSYELMLSQSRLAVFACGFHWGWRNIMMLALQCGIPVLTDRLLTEAYFDLKEFVIFEQEDHQWHTVEPQLQRIGQEQWEAYKQHNQRVYDKYMAPEAVAQYFINELAFD